MALERCWGVFRPPVEEPALLWFMRSYKTMETGWLWDHFASPHIGAPGGPLEAWQDPLVREIYLMFGTRLAKTWFGLGAMLWASFAWPAPCMFQSASKDLVERNISKAWKAAELSGDFGALPPEGRRKKLKMRLPRCTWESGWAESVSSLADKSAKYVHLSEISKWRYLKGTGEADPFALGKQRAAEWPDRKILGESTPGIRRRCRIEAEFQRGWGCRYFVPCPHKDCLRYQQLNMGRGEKGGIVYDDGPGGRRDPNIAKKTARYVCQYCANEIGNDVRSWMMNHGVWVPEGCDVDHDAALLLFEGLPEGVTHHREHLPVEERTYAWRGLENASYLRGRPDRPGEVASYQLSALYALFYGWGDIAAEWVNALIRPADKMQNVINSWFAQTYQQIKQSEEWEVLAKRLTNNVPPRTVPMEASIVTVGIDRQKEHLVFDAVAFAPGRRPFVIDYAYPADLSEVREMLLQSYPHEDGGPEVPITFAIIDINFHPTDEAGTTIHAWIKETNAEARRRGLPLTVMACRGANHPLHAPYKIAPMGKDSHCPGAQLMEVDQLHSQSWLDQLLYGRSLDDPTGAGAAQGTPTEEIRLQLYKAEPYEHEDYLSHLLNEGPSDGKDAQNKPRLVYKIIDENSPNDHRDGTRYALAALLRAIRNGVVPTRTSKRAEALPPSRPAPTSGGLKTPDGRNFFILNRR